MSQDSSPHPLDRPAARWVAVAVAIAALAALATIHRADLLAWVAGPAASADDPIARCVAGHHATIDQGVREGVFKAEQATLFKSRAEALCRATVGK